MCPDGLNTIETQELPSLAQPAVETQLLLMAAPEPHLDDALRVARALGIRVECLAAGTPLPRPSGDQLVVAVVTPGTWSELPLPQQSELLMMADVALILAGEPDARPEGLAEDQIFAYVALPTSTRALLKQVKSAALALLERRRARRLERELIHRTRELREVNAIGIALSTERNRDKLLSLILQKARELSGCDAGSLYLIEDHDGEKMLVFRVAQNDSLGLENLKPRPLPLSRKSLAGFVALTGQTLRIDDAYRLAEGVEYTFDRTSFDDRYGYRTKSVLVLPMNNTKGERIGVLQLINRRRGRGLGPLTVESCEEEVVPFSSSIIDLMLSLAGQAAISIENNRLYAEVRKLFEGFVKASVTAIEQRDPTTSGHSFRVATLTTGLAEIVDRSAEPRFRDVRFSADQMKEIRYAALLHDFGKVGVREEVLVKGKKLYPNHLELVRQRFAYIKKWIEAEALRRLFAELRAGADTLPPAEIERRLLGVEEEIQAEIADVDEGLATVLRSNEPTVLPEGSFEAIARLGSRTFRDVEGRERPFLDELEVRFLSIRKGSLDDDERRQIESHVTQTFAFLSQIPWTREFARVPAIAYAHHEKLTGNGYPLQLDADAIPIESRMMTVADIYDALTASDRPYKKAVPVDRALAIIDSEMKAGMLDADLVRLFVEAKIFEFTRRD